MIRRAALVLAVSALLAVDPTGATSARRDPAPQRIQTTHEALVELVGAWWAWLGYDPGYFTSTPDGRRSGVCVWGPLVVREFDAAGMDGRLMARTALRESGCDPRAVSPTDDHGLLQLNGVNRWAFAAVGCADRYSPHCNVRAAVRLAQEARRIWGDWYKPWRTS